MSLFSLQAIGADLSTKITANKNTYENNGLLIYTLLINNNSNHNISDISISADFTSLLTSKNKSVFKSTNILGKATTYSNTGEYAHSGDLLVHNAALRAYGTLTYTITATVEDELLAPIDTLVVKVTSKDSTSQTSAPIIKAPIYTYSVTLKADKTKYQIKQKLTYTLKVKNTGSDKIQHLSLRQDFLSLLIKSIDSKNIAAFSLVSLSANKNNKNSDVGTFLSKTDLNIENAIIAQGDTLTYTIQTTVNDKVIADIKLDTITQTNRTKKQLTSLITSQEEGWLEISKHTYKKTNDYYVNDALTIYLTVTNTSDNIVSQYHVKHNIATLVTNNANNLLSENNSTDIEGPLNRSWKFSVISLGENSTSALEISGEQKKKDFDDLVSIYPGEKIEYEINSTSSFVSIGDITSVMANIYDNDDHKTDENTIQKREAAKTINADASEIQITKSTQQDEYLPGETVVYDIRIKNTSNKFFANNLNILDKLSCIKSTQENDMPDAPAFTSWILEVVKSDDTNGSDPGKFNYGSEHTGDLQLSVDIAPGKEILYKLTATVSNTSIGPIFDSPDCNDTISENGTGVQMPDYNISILKDVDTNRYIAGGELTYTIKVANTGDGTANEIRVFDDLGAIMVTDIFGKQIPAYEDWKVEATSKHLDGSATIATTTGIKGTLENPIKFDVFATIEAHTVITYRIKVHVAATAIGNIQNTITVNNNLVANRLIYPYEPRVSFEKTALVNDLINGTNTAGYSKGSTIVTYKLVIENQKQAGFASNVKLIDNLTDIKAALLHSGKKVPVFSNWTTTVESEILDSSTINAKLQNKIINAIKTGLPADNENLDITLTIPPNTRITYTITAEIDRSKKGDIIWGPFTNIATLDLGNTYGTLTSDDSISPKPPRITVFKSSENENFVIGENVSFNIYIFNSGQGYANNVTVKDDIDALGIFEPNWTLEGDIDNHVDTGSKFDTTNTLQNGENINTVVDIDPDDKSSKYDGYGYVTYTITGVVKSDYDADNISNTVDIYDPTTNTHHSSTASIGKNNAIDKLNISILKTADRAQMIPGKDLTYSIMIMNNSDTITERHLTVTDMITNIKGVLANTKNTHYADVSNEQSPFDYWQIKLPGESSFGKKNNDDFIYPPQNSPFNLTLEPNEHTTFKIKVHVKDNFVGVMKEDKLNNIISNEASVYKNYYDAKQLSQVSLHEIHLAANHIEITKTIRINNIKSHFYKPGDTLSYFIEYASSTGYSNDTIVNGLPLVY